MNKKIVGIFVMGLLIGTMFAITNTVSACTDFTVSMDDEILVGANHDWTPNFNVYMHTFPVEEGKFGRVIFEYNFPLSLDLVPHNPNYIVPKQGMNDQGLFFDLLYTPELIPVNSRDKPIFNNDDPDYYQYGLWAYCLAKCSKVSEVLDIFNQYNLELMYFFQAFFVDKYGDSVIIEGDDIIHREGDYQVVTNFIQSHPELGGLGNAFGRYDTVVSMIENMTDFDNNYFKSICEATCASGTVFSNVYDLKQGIFYINYYQNYEKTLEFNLNEELSKGEQNIHLGSLFEPDGNNAPENPKTPTGNISGTPGVDYKYRVTVSKNDPDGDKTMFLFDWGDGTDSGWIMPSMNFISTTHNWTDKGTYEIKVKGIDVYGRESEWSDPLSVTMPKNKKINISMFLQSFFQRFPLFEKILNQIAP